MSAGGKQAHRMRNVDNVQNWKDPRAGTRAAAVDQDVAPNPIHYAVYRVTLRAGGDETVRCVLPDQPAPQPGPAMDIWLRRLIASGTNPLAISILVILEVLDANGAIRECALERRRGAVDGPLIGAPARVEFIGPARGVRLYQALSDGRLIEFNDGTANDDPAEPAPNPSTQSDPDQWEGEAQALRALFGPAILLIDRRKPLLFEDRVGLSSIVHLRLPDKRIVACGVGWHGGMPFILVANFPRFAIQPTLPPAAETQVGEALRRQGLERHELRVDDLGVAVIARVPGTTSLFVLRPDDRGISVTAVTEPKRDDLTDDQRRWLHYSESVEDRTILDLYRNGIDEQRIVVTGDPDGDVWKHVIDADGIEISAAPDNETAAAELYREALLTDSGSDAPQASDDRGPHADMPGPVPPDRLLAKLRAYQQATGCFRAVFDSCAGAKTPKATPSGEALARLSDAAAHASVLGAAMTVGILRDLIRLTRLGMIAADRLTDEIAKAERMLDRELAQLTVVTTVAGDGSADFGPDVEARFPEAVFHMQEIRHCLALRRPTAAVLHAMQIVHAGIAALRPDADTPIGEDWGAWRAAAMRHSSALAVLLDEVRLALRAPTPTKVDKYTEEEAETIVRAVGAFMRRLSPT